jgi:molybdenum cofactor biosynthesis enzyme
MAPETLARDRGARFTKGDVLAAQLAGIMGAKHTPI